MEDILLKSGYQPIQLKTTNDTHLGRFYSRFQSSLYYGSEWLNRILLMRNTLEPYSYITTGRLLPSSFRPSKVGRGTRKHFSLGQYSNNLLLAYPVLIWW